ncbi:hypothetical protein RIF29_28289 [Crotalaria pallida]|uniref:Uncharacterized protein n=1 Tax=Crotalaria pallida TaxID=3830 RepID=A0AAN9EQR4_CROPI
MGASGRWFKSLLTHKMTSTTDEEKGGDSNKSNMKKWKLWRTSSEGSMKNKNGESEKSCESSLYNVAVAAVQRWCDIPGTVDEVKTELRMRQQGAIKRDRAMAYSLSTQQSRMCGSPNSRTSKAVTPLKHHNLDSKSLGCSLLERWMATKPWESPISRKSEDLVPLFQSRMNGVTKRILVNKPLTHSTPSSSAISSECLPVSTSCTSGSPPSLPSTNVLEATEERDVHKLSYMNLTESTKAKMKACRSSSQNSKRQVMEDCMSHSSKTTFLNGDGRSCSGSDPSVNLWKDLFQQLVVQSIVIIDTVRLMNLHPRSSIVIIDAPLKLETSINEQYKLSVLGYHRMTTSFGTPWVRIFSARMVDGDMEENVSDYNLGIGAGEGLSFDLVQYLRG